jgi:hypothetical protein
MALLLGALSEAEREELAQALSDLADDIAVKRNPLVEQLDESDDAPSALGRELARLAARLAAATSLSGGQWASADGDVVVRAAAACPAAARCVRAMGDDGEPRARFLAWPIAAAAVLRPSPGEVDALRAAARAKGSTIALVLDAHDLHAPRASPALAHISSAAARVLRLAPADLPRRAVFQRLAAAGEPRDPAHWLALPDGAALVVPRIAALASRDAFAAEIRERAPHAAWLAGGSLGSAASQGSP